jgi:hypothetical protein
MAYLYIFDTLALMVRKVLKSIPILDFQPHIRETRDGEMGKGPRMDQSGVEGRTCGARIGKCRRVHP